MPEKYTVKITPQAQEQLREIIGYIRYTLQAPGTAMRKAAMANWTAYGADLRLDIRCILSDCDHF